MCELLQIIPLPGYYTVDHIYPIGFCSTRLYLSISGPSQMCLYTCKVSDSGTSAKVTDTFSILLPVPSSCVFVYLSYLCDEFFMKLLVNSV